MSPIVGPPVFACPVCGEPLPPAADSFVCANGHSFDVAREGYVNLLLAQYRRSKDPGYSKDMIAGRRDFFDAGHYAPLADGIAEQIQAVLPPGPDRVVVDAGCGEGYYLRRLRLMLNRESATPAGVVQGVTLCGMDISKHGIRVAARRDPNGLYAVAGTYRMPVLENRVDVLLTHFSPVSAEDFRRVVRPGGVVLVGGPGEGHLFSFKELLYDTAATHEPEATLAQGSGFELIDTHVIRYPLKLRGPGPVANLLLMTPFFWSVDDDARARLAALDALDTEVDVVVHAYRRTETTPDKGP
ncbi:MAG: putative RNA methyltransferase [Pseudonocardiaceae bacterium]